MNLGKLFLQASDKIITFNKQVMSTILCWAVDMNLYNNVHIYYQKLFV